MTTSVLFQVARDVFCVRGTAVNWILVRDGQDLTLVDGGYPGDIAAVIASIEEIGHRPEDVRAILVTHAHVDHLGAIGHFRDAFGTPALMHPDELAQATGAARQSATPVDVVRRAWRPAVLRWSLAIARAGAARHLLVPHAEAVADGQPLDLPGAPVPVHLPGHTSGSCAYLFGRAGVVATGDALVTGHPVSSIDGPQLLPDFFTHDPAAAMAAVQQLAGLAADTIAPGHGRPWSGAMTTAVELARRTAPDRLR